MKQKITLAGILLVCLFCINVQAQSVTVTSFSDSGPGSFRQAVLDANPGDVILFDPVLDNVTIILTNEVVINKPLIIQGNHSNVTRIGGGLNTRLLNINNATNVIINNITLREGGTPSNGAGILCHNTPLLINNSAIIGCKASGAANGQGGGGIYISFDTESEQNTLTINTSTIMSSQADGAQGSGGAIFSNNTITTLNNCIINHNTAQGSGGGLFNTNGILNLNDCDMENNKALGPAQGQGGGAICNGTGGVLNITGDSQFLTNRANGAAGAGGVLLSLAGSSYAINDADMDDNTAVRYGGAIADISGSENTIANTSLDGNEITGSLGLGGGIYMNDGSEIIMTGSILRNNIATQQGGGLWSGNGVVNFDFVTISNNTALGNGTADGGGGIYHNGGQLGLHNTSIINNHATGTESSGGGILFASGTGVFDISVLSSRPITGNTAKRKGGGISITGGTFNLNSCRLAQNEVAGDESPDPGNGGGLHVGNNGTNVTVSGSIIEQNLASDDGGGIWQDNNSILIIEFSTIAGNTSGNGIEPGTGNGGGIYSSGILSLNSTTVSGNLTQRANSNGGGIYLNTGGIVVSVTTTLSGNNATGNGGAMYINAGSTTINACTVAFNTAGVNGGGIYNNSATSPLLKNTIVQENTAVTGKDLFTGSAAFISQGYNLIGITDGSNMMPTALDFTGTLASPIDAGLMPLANNGGPTRTHRLECPSPAADRGNPADNFGDQRGQLVFNSRRDIGAFEAQQACSLGIEDHALTPHSLIYPNPTVNGIINLSIAPNHEGETVVDIYDITGKLVKKLKADIPEMQIATGLPAGTYIMRIVSGSTSETHKLIIN